MRTDHSRFIKRPLMCYYGSKFKFAEWVCGVLELIPHDVYVTPFGGSGGDLLGRTNPAGIEAYNDIDGTLCTLFHVLREPELRESFIMRLECTEYSQVNVREVVDILTRYDKGEELDPVLLAWAVYFRAWSSFAGTMHRSNMFGYVKNLIGGNNPPKQFRGAIEALPQIAGRLRDVQIFNEDFEPFVKRFDQGNNTLIYCLTPDTQVRMADESLVPIQALEKGQKVHGGRTILNVMSRQHDGDIIEARYLGYHKPLRMTPEHRVIRIPARTGTGRQERRSDEKLLSLASIARADELQKGDYLLMPTTGVEHETELPTFRDMPSRKAAVVNECPELYRFLGYFAAEGHTTKHATNDGPVTSTVILSFNNLDEANTLVQDAAECCRKAFGIEPAIKPGQPHPTSIQVVVHSTNVAQFVEGLVPGLQPKRLLNSQLMTAPAAVQIELLRGWFAGDGGPEAGSRNRSRIKGTTASTVMGDQMYTLCLRCGLKPSMWEDTKSDYKKRVILNGGDFSILFPGSVGIPRKRWPAARKLADGFILCRITDVAVAKYCGPVWDIDVDGDDLFPANFVLTHNCDPPYPMESRSGGSGYQHEADDELLSRIKTWALDAKCSVAISTYPCPWAQSFVDLGWIVYDKDVKAHSAMGRHGGEAGERTELILVNLVAQALMEDDFAI